MRYIIAKNVKHKDNVFDYAYGTRRGFYSLVLLMTTCKLHGCLLVLAQQVMESVKWLSKCFSKHMSGNCISQR